METDNSSVSKIPEPLRESVRQWLSRLFATPTLKPIFERDARLSDSLPYVLACSEYVGDVLVRYPDQFNILIDQGRIHRALDNGESKTLLADANLLDLSEAEFMRNLRLLRHRELLRIAWRDLCDWADLQETMRDLSSFADAAICSALSWAAKSLEALYGRPQSADGSDSSFVVLALGKLGGGELNFSSDIDLIFAYSEQGQTTGSRSISNDEFFRLLAQRIISLVSKQTSDGFVFRVDVRLRPFGDSGPLAISVAALEDYLAQHGRDWERYAYIKARVVNEWSGAEALSQQVLRPFVYRRYLDYGVFASLREMKALIEKEGRSTEFENNIKLGPGGIREIEFIVQSLQLVRGGSIETVREKRLLVALRELEQQQQLPNTTANQLGDAYCYLRRVENRLQEVRDRQVHELPKTETEQSRLALSMGSASWEEFHTALNQHRKLVGRHFENILLRGADESSTAVTETERAGIWGDELSVSGGHTELQRIGYPDPEEVLQLLKRLKDSSVYKRMDTHGRKRLDQLMPALITAAAAQEVPGVALRGALQIVEAIGRRSAYFSLLNENPAALDRLLSVCSTSQFLVQQVATHPLLLDELLDPRIFLQAPERLDLTDDLAVRMQGVSLDDPEQRLDSLRNFQQAAVFRVAVADLSGSLPLMKVSDRLTDIAELVLQAAYEIAWGELTARHGSPQCRIGAMNHHPKFTIIGYGKLGGIELGYASDLDLVFLHDSDGTEQITDGEKPLENAVFFARLARRILHILTMPTTSGKLYEVDTRLRPSGRSGLMVASLTAFERYQRDDAWTWEHQALLRSRFVAGDSAVGDAFEKLRIEALRQFVHRDDLKNDVVSMRERMRKELSKGSKEEFDIKQGEGGLTDIEFLVQYLVLEYAERYPNLITYSDNIRQLEALVESEIMPSSEAEQIADIYRSYRTQLHRLALAGKPRLAAREEYKNSARIVSDVWQKYLG